VLDKTRCVQGAVVARDSNRVGVGGTINTIKKSGEGVKRTMAEVFTIKSTVRKHRKGNVSDNLWPYPINYDMQGES